MQYSYAVKFYVILCTVRELPFCFASMDNLNRFYMLRLCFAVTASMTCSLLYSDISDEQSWEV